MLIKKSEISIKTQIYVVCMKKNIENIRTYSAYSGYVQ